MNTFDTLSMIIRICFRSILRQKRRSMLVISSAAMGIIGIILTIAFMNAFFSSIMDSGIKSGLGHVQIRPEGYNETRKMGLLLDDPDSIRNKLQQMRLKDINYSERLEKEGLLRIGSFTRGVVFIGIQPDNEAMVSNYAKWIDEGTFLKSSGHIAGSKIIPCIIGRANAEKMEIHAGDWAIVSLSDHKGIYRSIRCSVQGIFSSAIGPVDRYTVLLNRRDLSNLFAERDDLVSYFVFLGNSLESSVPLKKNLLTSFSDTKNLEVLSYEDLESYFTKTMELIDYFTWIFYLLMLIGVALILFDSIMMSIFERMRELGIMHALGSKPSFIFFMVMFESILLTLVGCILGLVFSQSIILYFQINGLDLSYFSRAVESMGKMGNIIYPYLTLKNNLEAILFPLIISIFAALFPALKAVKISPIRAIYNR